METKKSNRKDLESKKVLFFEVGLAVALLLAFMAFDVRTERNHTVIFDRDFVDIVEPMVPITVDDLPKPEPLPDNKQLAMVITDVIQISDIDLPNVVLFTDPSMLDTSKFKAMARVVVPEEVDPDEVIPEYDVQKKPKFMGKEPSEFPKWVYSKIKYPEEAASNNIQGTVYLSFVIGKDGKLSNIQSLRQIDPLLADEVMRVVKSAPDWEPGMQGVRKVNVSYQIAIHFRLQ